jgi:hypothetical protein
MLHPSWIEREAPLDACPLKSCRRDGVCRHNTGRDPCRRLHERTDAMRYKLAMKLQAWTREAQRLDPEGKNRVEPGSYEHERRLHILKEMLHARDAAHTAEKMKALRAARKKQRA